MDLNIINNNMANSLLTPANDRSIQLLVSYYHAALGCPPISTMITALRKNLISLPGITYKTVQKYKPDTTATALGHLDLNRQGIQSTKPEISEDSFPSSNTIPSNKVHISTRKNFTDMTGQLPIESFNKNNYILLMYSEDANYLHVEPQASKSAADRIKAYAKGIEFFNNRGFKPITDTLDNETSREFEKFCKSVNITTHYVPPHNHRANKAERAIRSFKNHFITILSSIDKSFPIQAWDGLLPFAEMTINLLRTSNVDNNISAWHAINGSAYNFNRNPIAPPGTKVIVHDSPSVRGTWDPHGKIGFYLGPSIDHYRAHYIFMQDSNRIRVSDTVSWQPAKAHIPAYCPIEGHAILTQALEDTVKELIDPSRIHDEKSSQDLDKLLQSISNCSSKLTKTRNALVQILNNSPHPDLQRVLPPANHPEQRVAAPLPPDIHLEQRVPEDIVVRAQINVPSTIQAEPKPLPKPKRKKKRHHGYHVSSSSLGPSPVVANKEKDLTYRRALLSPDKAKWETAASEEFNRLINTTGTMSIIKRCDIPPGRTISYYNPQVKIKVKNNVITYRVRGTYGGNISDYFGEVTARTAELVTVKALIQSTISKLKKWLALDITDFYLGSDMERPEFMFVYGWQIPMETRIAHGLENISDDDIIYFKIVKGIYGLKQAGKLAQDQLFDYLLKCGFIQAANTPCLFKHSSKDITFCLVVDDFGVSYGCEEDALYLINALKNKYKITIDWEGKKYLGMDIDMDYSNRSVSISMPGYVKKALLRFHVDKVSKNTNSPMTHIPPNYGQKIQFENTIGEDDIITDPTFKKNLQQIIGVFLYYARAVDPTMIVAVNKLASQQNNPTSHTAQELDRFLQYAATWPETKQVYYANDMKLIAYSDASHQSESESRSRAGAVFYLGSSNGTTHNIHGILECISVILPTVTASATESEYGALFECGKQAEAIRNLLEDLGHPQGTTNLICDNMCATAIANDSCKQRKSKAIAMRYHWIRDRIKQHHFSVTWKPGIRNLADFFTKCLPVYIFSSMRKFFVWTNKIKDHTQLEDMDTSDDP